MACSWDDFYQLLSLTVYQLHEKLNETSGSLVILIAPDSVDERSRIIRLEFIWQTKERKREQDFLELLSGGKFYKEIAAELHISIETVKSHCHNIYEKLHVSTRTEALNKYYAR